MPSLDELKSYATEVRRATRNEKLLALCDYVLAVRPVTHPGHTSTITSTPTPVPKPKRDRAAYMRDYRRKRP